MRLQRESTTSRMLGNSSGHQSRSSPLRVPPRPVAGPRAAGTVSRLQRRNPGTPRRASGPSGPENQKAPAVGGTTKQDRSPDRRHMRNGATSARCSHCGTHNVSPTSASTRRKRTQSGHKRRHKSRGVVPSDVAILAHCTAKSPAGNLAVRCDRCNCNRTLKKTTRLGRRSQRMTREIFKVFLFFISKHKDRCVGAALMASSDKKLASFSGSDRWRGQKTGRISWFAFHVNSCFFQINQMIVG